MWEKFSREIISLEREEVKIGFQERKTSFKRENHFSVSLPPRAHGFGKKLSVLGFHPLYIFWSYNLNGVRTQKAKLRQTLEVLGGLVHIGTIRLVSRC